MQRQVDGVENADGSSTGGFDDGSNIGVEMGGPTKRTARAWLYREQLRDIVDRKQINVVSAMLGQWCTNVMRSKVEPMKEVAAMIRKHFEGIAEKERPAELNGGPASL